MRIRLINGPNLNLLGRRESHIYGVKSYDDLLQMVTDYALKLAVKIDCFQSNHEGDLIDWVQQDNQYDALIINPAGYSHTSVALLDALLIVKKPKIEVHISNVYEREAFRRNLITAQGVDQVIAGHGLVGYTMAIDRVVNF